MTMTTTAVSATPHQQPTMLANLKRYFREDGRPITIEELRQKFPGPGDSFSNVQNHLKELVKTEVVMWTFPGAPIYYMGGKAIDYSQGICAVVPLADPRPRLPR